MVGQALTFVTRNIPLGSGQATPTTPWLNTNQAIDSQAGYLLPPPCSFIHSTNSEGLLRVRQMGKDASK